MDSKGCFRTAGSGTFSSVELGSFLFWGVPLQIAGEGRARLVTATLCCRALQTALAESEPQACVSLVNMAVVPGDGQL